jgi:hypothetical protein
VPGVRHAVLVAVHQRVRAVSRPDEDVDWEPCPPHILVLCGLCGHDVCDDCGNHFNEDGEELDECPASTVSSS